MLHTEEKILFRKMHLTGLDDMESYLEFLRHEKRRSGVMTQTRIQLCCKAIKINIADYNGKKNYPRTVTEKNEALYFYKDHY